MERSAGILARKRRELNPPCAGRVAADAGYKVRRVKEARPTHRRPRAGARQMRSPDAAQRVALAKRCAAEPGPRLLGARRKLAARRNRGPGSAKRHEECRIAPGTRGMQISKFNFKQPRLLVLAPPREFKLLVFSPPFEGRRSAERRALVVKMRPSDAPSRRLLRPRDRRFRHRPRASSHPGRLWPTLLLFPPAI
jgi:hypothetical protein